MKGTSKKTLIVLMLSMVMMFAMSICAYAAAPTGLKQKDDGKDWVQVEWSTLGEDASYIVQLASDASFSATSIISSKDTYSESYSFFNLLPGSTYYVRVGYKNVFSTPIDVVTTPVTPSGLSFIGADDYSVSIAWLPSPGASGYIATYAGINTPTLTNSVSIPYAGSGYIDVRAVKQSAAGYLAISGYDLIGGSSLSKLTTRIPRENFAVTALISGAPKIGCAGFSGHGYEVEATPVKGKGVLTASSEYTYVTLGTMKKNTMYKVRVRAYVTLSNGAKQYGQWSDYRYCLSPMSKGGRSYGGIMIKIPKLSGVSKAAVYVSTKEDTGYKKCAVLSGVNKSSKTYVVSRIGKKYLKRWTRYYVKVEYFKKSTKDKDKSDIISRSSYLYY